MHIAHTNTHMGGVWRVCVCVSKHLEGAIQINYYETCFSITFYCITFLEWFSADICLVAYSIAPSYCCYT